MRKITKHARFVALSLAIIIFFASCSSTTIIRSIPPGARLYIDGEPAGTTPYEYSDTKIVGSKTHIEMVKEGYEPYNTTIQRLEEADVGAIIAGFFCIVPFLWTMKYKPVHTYELIPLYGTTIDDHHEYFEELQHQDQNIDNFSGKSKIERLEELKEMLNKGLITQEDYDIQKAKILNENN